MALSRTARILIAVLLLAAAAFFWVNFFYQERLAEPAPTDPTVDTVATTQVDDASDAQATADGQDLDTDADVLPADDEVSEEAGEQDDAQAAADGDAADDAAAPAVGDEEAPAAATPPVVVPPVVVLDAPVAVSRDIVVADLPFLITSPLLPATQVEDDAQQDPALRVGAVGERVISNPFSPVILLVRGHVAQGCVHGRAGHRRRAGARPAGRQPRVGDDRRTRCGGQCRWRHGRPTAACGHPHPQPCRASQLGRQ